MTARRKLAQFQFRFYKIEIVALTVNTNGQSLKILKVFESILLEFVPDSIAVVRYQSYAEFFLMIHSFNGTYFLF